MTTSKRQYDLTSKEAAALAMFAIKHEGEDIRIKWMPTAGLGTCVVIQAIRHTGLGMVEVIAERNITGSDAW